MNLRTRLNLTVTAVLLVIVMIGAFVAVHNARQSVLAEVDSTMALALHMLDAELTHFNRNGRQVIAEDASPFDLGRLSGVRHLRIEYYDALGHLLETNQIEDSYAEEQPPSWFIQQMKNGLDTVHQKVLPVHLNNRQIGSLIISPEPSNEIIETWDETKTLIIMLVLFFIAVNIVVYIVVARALKPINNIIDALTDIEAGHLERRLPVFNLPEMTSISHKFNLMASALQSSIANNHRLTQQILRLQEEERKSLAHELHDEIGQHLTAIHVDASVIKNSQDLNTAKQSAVAIDGVIRQMMDILRSMLERLRPGGLDETAFVVALQELIDAWQERHQHIDVNYQIRGQFSAMDETVQLTLYRVMQECLTNITRHSNANDVWIELVEDDDKVGLSVRDNGHGFEQKQHSQRFGLAGMRERVDSVNGQFSITTALNEGVTITILIPKQGDEA